MVPLQLDYDLGGDQLGDQFCQYLELVIQKRVSQDEEIIHAHNRIGLW